MKKLLVILCLFTFTLPLFAYTHQEDSYEEFLQNKLDLFLYYEIRDAFCRRHGYKIENESLITKKPARIEVTSDSRATDGDYRRFYDNYKDYISGAKSPSSEFIEARKKLEEKNISAKFIPESEEVSFYRHIAVNATDKQEINEVDKVWMAKKGKVKPKPYSFEMELNKYKVLTQNDILFIIDEFKSRFCENKMAYYPNSGRIYGSDMNLDLKRQLDSYFDRYYYKCEGNYELFRQYAKEIDERFKNFYPQNLTDENPQSWRGAPYLDDNPHRGTKDFDSDVDVILGAFEGVVETSQYFTFRIGDNRIAYNWLGFGNRIVKVGKTKVIRDKKGKIIAIGEKKITRDEKGNVLKIGEDVVKRNGYNVIVKVGNKKFFRNGNGNVFYIGNPIYTTDSHGNLETINGETVIMRKGMVMRIGKKDTWADAFFYIDAVK